MPVTDQGGRPNATSTNVSSAAGDPVPFPNVESLKSGQVSD